MKRWLIAAAILSSAPVWAANKNWVLDSGAVSYEADHPFHNTVGKTTELKGKGECKDGACEFLVAAPVKSFDSGDSNRDVHMLQAVKGAEFPLVSVRAKVPESQLVAGSLSTDLIVTFGGVEVTYAKVPFVIESSTAGHFRISGTVPLDLVSHKIDRPSLFGVAIKSAAPVTVDLSWKEIP